MQESVLAAFRGVLVPGKQLVWGAGSCHCGLPVLIDHKMGTDQVGRDLERESGTTIHGKGSVVI